MFLARLCLLTMLIGCSGIYSMHNEHEDFIVSETDVDEPIYARFAPGIEVYGVVLRDRSSSVYVSTSEHGIYGVLARRNADETDAMFVIPPANFHVIKNLYNTQQRRLALR